MRKSYHSTKNNEITKIDPYLLHCLPFSPSHIRRGGFKVSRVFGTTEMTVTAFETLNHLDLLTILQLSKYYITNRSEYGESARVDGFEVLKGYINLAELATERGLLNKKANRKTILDSIKRLKSADVDFTYLNKFGKPEKTVYTKYIFQIEAPENNDLNEVAIIVNKAFLDFCIDNGVIVNISRLYKYKSAYTFFLDVFLQGTHWNSYDEGLLFEKIGLDIINMPGWEKRRMLKKAFWEIKTITGLDFQFQKNSKKWVGTPEYKIVKSKHRKKGKK